MDNTFITIIIFIIILFLYIHIVDQYKKSEDLEIYEMDYNNEKQLQDVCNVKQPTIFEFQTIFPLFFEKINASVLDSVYNSDVRLKDANDYYSESASDTRSQVDYVVLPFHSSRKLMNTDPSSHFFIENNNEFVEESDFYKLFSHIDHYLKPNLTLQTKYDFCMGSKNTITPLRYHTNYRQFFIVTSGKIHIKLTPWKSSKYLYPVKDFENYEFRSPVNVWKPQPKYSSEMEKMKFLEFEVTVGNVIYIPPYWWYSIKYSNEDDNIVCGFTYNSIMNVVANVPNWILYFIQQQNTKKKVAKTLKIEESQIFPEENGQSDVSEEVHLTDSQPSIIPQIPIESVL